MKRLALIAALFLLRTGAAVAQQDMGHLSLEGAGYTTGVVEATTDDSMTIRKDSGELVTVLLDESTVGGSRPLGTRVRVDFHRDDRNRAIADEIQGFAPLMAQAAETMPLGVGGTATAAPEAPAPAAAAAPAPVTAPAPAAGTAMVSAAPAARKLPATASPLPALALAGLLALSGALTLRAVR